MRLTTTPKTAPQDHAAPSLEIPSLRFGDNRLVLRVGEFAERVCCTEQHTIDLLEEGKLAGVDISGRFDWMRMPAAAIDALATRFKVPPQAVVEIIHATQPTRRMARAFWRIPVKEGYEVFLRENHSLALR